MKIEVWKDVKGFEGIYQISSFGNVKGLDRQIKTTAGLVRKIKGKAIKPRINNCGYVEVRLSKNGYTKTFFIHRLIAEAFIPNPLGKPHINHVDGIKTNNSTENLSWVTHSENIKHAYALKLKKVSEKICKKVIDTCTNNVYTSISEAAKALQIAYSTCKNYLNGSRPNPTCLRYAA